MEKEKQNQENILDKMGITFHRTLSFKLAIIGMLILIMLIPKFMILELIKERSANSETAINEVMSKWSNMQTISGPVLIIPFKTNIYNEKEGVSKEIIQTATFLPKGLNIQGNIYPEKLNRSIYNVAVYTSKLNFSGEFETPDFNSLNIKNEDVLWENAHIQLAIEDLRGISEEVILLWNDKKITFSPGLQKTAIGHTGISVLLKDNVTDNFQGKFQISLDLKGSRNLMFTPVGEKTTVELESTWNDPGFIGNFLPNERIVEKSGFNAKWNVLHFNRNFPQSWINDQSQGVLNSDITNSAFGVELVTMANHYQKNTRSAKYAILIIIITFIVFFMFEVFTKQRIHPFQYVLVGSAITIFYLLLLSISEHLGFNLAYFIATLSVMFLVFFYSRSFMPKLKNSIGIGLSLAACYAFIFILLQLESYALLAGSIGLFVLLAMLMYFTRKINWYKE